MILAVDVGNTETHVGLFRDDALDRDWRLATQPVRTSDDYAQAMTDVLRDAGIQREALAGIVLGSVVPSATASLEAMARQWIGRDPVTVGPNLKMPIEICTKDPAEVGADRIANAVGGCDWREPPVIVVDLGTATTFDVVGRGRRYLGGVICPGVITSLDDLIHRTAKLPSVEIQKPTRVIGTDTEECMRSGIVFGAAEQIDGVLRRVWEELGTECPAIVTGGLAPLIAPFCKNIKQVDRHLTLKGLKRLFDLNG